MRDTDALVQEVVGALRQVDLRAFADLSRGFREGMAHLLEARSTLVSALADNRVEELELLNTRHVTLQAIAALRPSTFQGGQRGERLLKIIGALKGVADCFFELEVVAQPPPDAEAPAGSMPRPTLLAEFSLETFEARLQQLLETIRTLGELDPTGTDDLEDPAAGGAGDRHLEPLITHLELIAREARPGNVYGALSRRENPYLAARALRAGCSRLQSLLLSRYALQEPLDRLARLEGRFTSFIEEIRTAGAPIEEPEGWLRRRRGNKLEALRGMCQEMTEIEQALREKFQEREP